jgi:Ca2+-transporting ATPase
MKKYYQQSIDEVVKYSETDLKTGLSSSEVKKRLDEIGPNQLEEKKGRTPWDMFLGQFKDVLVLILLISALVAFILGEVSDAIVIAIILILNATLGVVQEYKAEKSLAALKKMTTTNALVIRDGKQTRIKATQLVPGDIVLLESGDHIPADLRLSVVTNLKIQEAVLTGESVPVEKKSELIDKENVSLGDRNNLAFMGTAVISGRGRGIVVATGMKTEMGQIAGMLEEQKQEDTPLQKKLNQVGKKLGLIILIVVGFVVLLGYLRGIGFFEMFLIGISLAVAAVPEGLPAVVTVVLALGVQRMIKKHVIVRRLPAVETLGATTVICSDKTGTLTQNQMTVRKLVLPEKNIEVEGEGYQPVGKFYQTGQEIEPQKDPDLSLLLKGAVLCNNAELQKNNDNEQWEIIGDPTEGALVVTAVKAGYDKNKLEEDYPRVIEFPFDSDRKQMSTIHQTAEGNQIIFVKGAPDQVIDHCKYYQINGTKEELGDSIKNKVLSQNRELAQEALRVLAIAYRFMDKENLDEIKEIKDAEKELIFLGLMAMIDPPRKEAIESVKTCLRAGIHPIMITGDYSLTAKAIASELGIYIIQEIGLLPEKNWKKCRNLN